MLINDGAVGPPPRWLTRLNVACAMLVTLIVAIYTATFAIKAASPLLADFAAVSFSVAQNFSASTNVRAQTNTNSLDNTDCAHYAWGTVSGHGPQTIDALQPLFLLDAFATSRRNLSPAAQRHVVNSNTKTFGTFVFSTLERIRKSSLGKDGFVRFVTTVVDAQWTCELRGEEEGALPAANPGVLRFFVVIGRGDWFPHINFMICR